MGLYRRDDSRPTIEVTPYQRRYRQDVRELLYRSYRSHVHLDWQETDNWLDTGRSPVLLAWIERRLVGVMGTSEPLDGECWIRLAAVVDDENPIPIFDMLWSVLRLDLRVLHVKRVALLMLRDWLTEIVERLNFTQNEVIVTLKRESTEQPPDERPHGLVIRPADPADQEAIEQVDHAAFGALWSMTANDLRHAMRGAASCTVGVLEGTIVGYQLSTVYFDGSHLARLAVLPDLQANGIGAALVSDVLRRFLRRGIPSMTVNTQLSNERSQRLYARLGFQRTGYDLPVWMISL